MTATWRVAKSLDKLLAQLDEAHPGRSKASDGAIGDTAHQGTKSEHNPDAGGVVRARDYTHDPAHGLDAGKLADALLASRDARILYVISNGRIGSSYPVGDVPAWTWRPYHGVNAHKSHVHVSVVSTKDADSSRKWAAVGGKGKPSTPAAADGSKPGKAAPAFPLPRGFVFGPFSGPVTSVSGRRQRLANGKPGHRGLLSWQARMAERGWTIAADGLYGDETAGVVRAFEKEKGLHVDGLIDPATWAAAWTARVTA